MGTIPKDAYGGKFMAEWKSVLQKAPLDSVDVSLGIGNLFSIKDEDELVRFSLFLSLACRKQSNNPVKSRLSS